MALITTLSDWMAAFHNRFTQNSSWIIRMNRNIKASSQLSLRKPSSSTGINTLRLRQNGCQFPDDILKCIFMNENITILIKISLQFVLKGPTNNTPVLVQILAWHRSGDKPLSEPMMVNLLTHICVTQPQWVKTISHEQSSFIFPKANNSLNFFHFTFCNILSTFYFCHTL